MNRNIGGYVAGNLVISLICGVVTTVSLYLLDVPYSLALGVFMAVFDIIPLVGATIGSFVVVASGLIFVDVRTGVILFVIVNVYQQIENHILQPMIYGRTVQIPSLTILIAVLAAVRRSDWSARCSRSRSPPRSRRSSASCSRNAPSGSRPAADGGRRSSS